MTSKIDRLDAELEELIAETARGADAIEATDEIAAANRIDTTWRETTNLARLSLRELSNLDRFIERETTDDLVDFANIQALKEDAEKAFIAHVKEDNVGDYVASVLPKIWIADVSDVVENGLVNPKDVTRYLVDGWVSRKILLDVCSALPATKTFVNVHIIYTPTDTVVSSLELTGMLIAELRKHPRNYSTAERIKLCERLLKHFQDRAVEKQIPMPALYKFASACLISRRTVMRLNQKMLANYPGIIITREHLTRSGKVGTAKYTTPTKPRHTSTASNTKHIEVVEDQGVASDKDATGVATDTATGTFVVDVPKSAIHQPIQELSFRDTVKYATDEHIDHFVDLALTPFSSENLMRLVDVAKRLHRFNSDDTVVTNFVESLETIKGAVQSALEQIS
jgi:hypothetical protein